jgi:hypothetical protein
MFHVQECREYETEELTKSLHQLRITDEIFTQKLLRTRKIIIKSAPTLEKRTSHAMNELSGVDKSSRRSIYVHLLRICRILPSSHLVIEAVI